MKILAYAKLNLALDITGRLENGYHTLAAVNHSVGLADEIELRLGDSVIINCDDPNVPTGSSNTCYKAVERFCDYTGVKTGVNITIRKNIPSQAGMGGASADAAAVLAGLNSLTGSGLDTRQLIEIGVKVGADVPFCLVGGAAFCAGIGEEITPLPPLRNCTFVVVKPDLGVSTAEAYARYDQYRGKMRRPNIDEMIAALEKNDVPRVGIELCNVFEEICGLDEIKTIKSLLKEGSFGSLMTGSGSAVFGLFGDAGMCSTEIASGEYGRVYICPPVNCGYEIIER